MINIIDTDYICSPLEYSNHFKDGAEGQVSPSDMTFPQSRPGANVLGGIAAGTRISDSRSQHKATRITGMAVAYMLQNLDKPIQMPALATLTEVSMSQFHHLFKLATGCTPNSFLIRARMRRACKLLRGTDLNVKEVAAALGYSDQFYFSRVFKSVKGVSPSQYSSMAAELEEAPKERHLSRLKERFREDPSLSHFQNHNKPRGIAH